ncbi:hypothetical protein GC093_18400 [Paenibacillus sp. LMG 31456]|uniref:Uncharacterized protein n=1 Tax=Paenibacillus foliorum TaxID=2654974 RepID=A0A972GVX5_9BACL|nr:hypothetical protein [Paenibacillus foliorum]NOU95178.1 hypothetical protein [Paenibacillus foliorum]
MAKRKVLPKTNLVKNEVLIMTSPMIESLAAGLFLIMGGVSLIPAVILLILRVKLFKYFFLASGVGFYYFLVIALVVPYIPPFGSMSSEESRATNKASVENYFKNLPVDKAKLETDSKMKNDEAAKKKADDEKTAK